VLAFISLVTHGDAWLPFMSPASASHPPVSWCCALGCPHDQLDLVAVAGQRRDQFDRHVVAHLGRQD
jgi:hypothetical protein